MLCLKLSLLPEGIQSVRRCMDCRLLSRKGRYRNGLLLRMVERSDAAEVVSPALIVIDDWRSTRRC
jgi:hypothetical protein